MELRKALRRIAALDSKYGKRTMFGCYHRGKDMNEWHTAMGWLQSLTLDLDVDCTVMHDRQPSLIKCEDGKMLVVDAADGRGILALEGIGKKFLD
jgi:hypothetical protein